MSFTGKIEDVSVAELLQFLAFNEKTGKLSVTRRDGHGLVVFRRGRIIYAASNSVRDAFGNILVRRGLVSEETLAEALERHSRSTEEKRLGTVLIEMGAVAQADLEDVMRRQTEEVAFELACWKTGFFRFSALQIPERGEIEVDAKDFLVSGGLNTEGVLLEIARRLDERRTEEAAAGEGVSLLDLIDDVLTPVLRGELTLTLMRQAAQVLSRGVLLAVRGEEARAVGHFGFHATGDARIVAELRIPLAPSSLLGDVVERRETYRGPVPSLPANQALLEAVGPGGVAEALFVPIVVAGHVAMVFYGDNLPEAAPILSTAGLELAMAEAGLAMEKEALEARSHRLRRARAPA